jgi:hypothetical protein
MRDFEYEKNNIAYDCQYPQETGGGIKCKNYEICEQVLPLWWYDCKGKYLCSNCDRMFGTWSNLDYGIFKTGKGVLPLVNNVECPICLNVKKSIEQPNCTHTLCIDCLKRCYYVDFTGAPEFSYSKEVEDFYYMDHENYNSHKLKKDFPMIENWGLDFDKWYDHCIEKYNNESYLRVCPICRK